MHILLYVQYLSQNSGETQDLKGVSSDAVRVIAALAGTVASCSDFDVDSTVFRPLFIAKGGLRSRKIVNTRRLHAGEESKRSNGCAYLLLSACTAVVQLGVWLWAQVLCVRVCGLHTLEAL